jgi:hypothetical protein
VITPARVCGQPSTLPGDVIVDLGNGGALTSLTRTTDRVLVASQVTPSTARWVLWDPSTALQVASASSAVAFGDVVPPFFLTAASGGTAVEVRSMTDGQVAATAPVAAAGVRLAADGSYLWKGGLGGVTAWDLTGNPILSQTGNYSAAKMVADGSEVRAIGGPAGTSVLERLPVNGGTRTTAAFNGSFLAWAPDGQTFATQTSNIVRVYDATGAQVGGTLQLVSGGVSDPYGETFAGTQGNLLWTTTVTTQAWTLSVYEVGSPFTSLGQVTLPGSFLTRVSRSGPTFLALEPSTPEVATRAAHRVMATAAGPTLETFDVPNDLAGIASASPGGDFVGSVGIGGNVPYIRGVPGDALATAFLGCGPLRDSSGTANGLAALATTTGVLVVDALTQRHLGTLPGAADHVTLSADGTLIVAAKDGGSTRSHSWPDGTLVHEFDPLVGTGKGGVFSLATASRQIGHFYTGGRQVTDAAGTTDLFHDAGLEPLELSPSGKLLGATRSNQFAFDALVFYDQDHVQTNDVPGHFLTWLDDSTVLADTYDANMNFQHLTVYGDTGTVIRTISLPSQSRAKPISSSSIYGYQRGAIYDLSTAQATWTAPTPHDRAGVVAGGRVLYSAAGLIHVATP